MLRELGARSLGKAYKDNVEVLDLTLACRDPCQQPLVSPRSGACLYELAHRVCAVSILSREHLPVQEYERQGFWYG